MKSQRIGMIEDKKGENVSKFIKRCEIWHIRKKNANKTLIIKYV